MGIFSRSRDIFAANITELLDRSEDPAKMIRMVILEMEETLVEVRASAARCIADGKEMREFDGQTYVMERGLVADLAIIHAWKGDREGNLVYRKTARNFNPVMATAGSVTVAEVEHLVEPGEIDPDHIHTPGIFVKRLIHPAAFEKRIEQRTVRKRG